MSRPGVTAAVGVCRVVLGEVSADMADALAAAEAWASGEQATLGEYLALYGALNRDGERGESVYWVLAASYDVNDDESAFCTEQCLATLAALPGWDDESVQALYASKLAPHDTIPAPAPEFQEAA